MKPALYYESISDNKVHCHLCPHNCIIAPDKLGICRQRKNINGALYSLNYGQVSSVNLDPIEKKPLYHFYPGSAILSIGTNGCNLACQFCQNWSISQEDSATNEFTPAKAVELIPKYKSIGLAYTYNEPFIWYEFVLETSKLAHSKGFTNVLVTNGFVSPEPLAEILPYIDAINIDIKSIEPSFYRRLCKARLEPVLETCKTVKTRALVEITNLVIPGENDTDEQFEKLAKWIADNLGRDTPLHFSAYYPAYKMANPPTQPGTLLRAYEIGRKFLDYVYLGNARLDKGNDTFCAKCNTRLIERRGYNTQVLSLTEDGKCSRCGAGNNISV